MILLYGEGKCLEHHEVPGWSVCDLPVEFSDRVSLSPRLPDYNNQNMARTPDHKRPGNLTCNGKGYIFFHNQHLYAIIM